MGEGADCARQAPLTVTLIANQGIFVEFMGTALLVDAIHDDSSTGFSPVPSDTLNEMLRGGGSFSNAQFLLFTHTHPDHFSAARTEQYLRRNTVEAVFFPHDAGALFAAASAAQRNALSLLPGQKQTYRLSDHIRITFFRTKHAGSGYGEVEHYCALLHLGGHNLLLTGDADCDRAYFQMILEETPVDTVFVNPLFLSRADGRDTILHAFRPRNIVIYHLPFAESDRMGMRRLVDRNLARFGRLLPPVTVLQQTNEVFRLSVPLALKIYSNST